MHDAALVITSIAPPNAVLQLYASQCLERGIEFILIGDAASPADFSLTGCRFYSLDEQRELNFKLAQLLPVRHYARKNLGYLLTRHRRILLETDDDNLPQAHFWNARPTHYNGPLFAATGWTNIYRCFTDAPLWPRGFPLTKLRDAAPQISEAQQVTQQFCPIQHGLTDGQPDVDAVFRLVHGVNDVTFKKRTPLMLGAGAWCPFNSQSTAWLREAYPLLYLPATCTFRMTDIWRSFIAQRIAWECGWPILFHAPMMYQERNPHDLLRDFTDEVPGYLHNTAICQLLEALPLRSGIEHIYDNLRTCYQTLVKASYLQPAELPLVEAWLEDIAAN